MPWQPHPIVYPDVELLVTTALRELLADHGQSSVQVVRTVPTARPARLVAVTRDGGSHDGVTDRPRVRVRVWDTSAEAATSLAGLVVALMQQLAVTEPQVVASRHLSGPIEIPDNTSAGDVHQRYLLFELATEGEALP